MKNIGVIMMVLICSASMAQTFSEKINKEYTFEKVSADNAVMVANINGNVTVEGYDGDKVILEVNKWISGKTQARLDMGKRDLQLGVIDRADTLIFYIEDGCTRFQKSGRGRNTNSVQNSGWGYNWNNDKDGDCDREYSYDYKMDFVLKVPRKVHLLVSTINEGDIDVKGVSGAVHANNVNGAIKLVNLMRESVASTINEDVDIEYNAHPKNDCRFYSLNGDINAFFPKGLGAELSFDSFNGEFYTNLQGIEQLPVAVQKNSTGKGFKYKINGNRYKVGDGGAFLDFETFNGNVYLKER